MVGKTATTIHRRLSSNFSNMPEILSKDWKGISFTNISVAAFFTKEKQREVGNCSFEETSLTLRGKTSIPGCFCKLWKIFWMSIVKN